MSVLIFGNPTKSDFQRTVLKLLPLLKKLNLHAETTSECAKILNLPLFDKTAPKNYSMILSLGGDGTILRAVRAFDNDVPPIVGLNLGRLGFMADISIDESLDALETLLDSHSRIVNQTTISGSVASAEHSEEHTEFALNDIIIHRGNIPHLIDLAVFVDGCLINTFSADGIIFATPNGSTAYSLSAGGPILDINVDGILITPICPHTTLNKSVVVNPKKSINVVYLNDYGPIQINYDGVVHLDLAKGQNFICKKGTKEIPFLKPQEYDYFVTLRSKLNWNGLPQGFKKR